MALHEYCVGDGIADAWSNFAGVAWGAQTFTPTTAHYISKVALFLYKIGAPSAITVSIRDTSGEDPSGVDKAVGTISADIITTSTDGAWVYCNLTTLYSLSASTLYSIVLRCTGDGSNMVNWGRYQGSSPYNPYANGTPENSPDSGSTWITIPFYDFMFKEYSSAVYPSDAQTRVTSLIHRYDRGTYTLELGLGEVIADFGLPEWDKEPRGAIQEEEEERIERLIKKATEVDVPLPGRVMPRVGFAPPQAVGGFPPTPSPTIDVSIRDRARAERRIIPTAKVTEERPFDVKLGILQKAKDYFDRKREEESRRAREKRERESRDKQWLHT